MAVVNKIIHGSFVDGPGNRTVVFLQGCNFKCAYCHNPETIAHCTACGTCIGHCPAGALSMCGGHVQWDETLCCECDRCIHVCPRHSSPRTKNYTATRMMEEIRKDIPFIRGITVSGGECTMQREFLLELFQLARKEGLSTLTDSNGSYDYSLDDELLRVCDGVMLDVKAYDTDAHIKLTGMDNQMVLKNAVFLAKHGKLEEIRTVIVPEYLPNEDTVDRITKLLKPYLVKKPVRYKLIAYRQAGVRDPYKKELKTPDFSIMQRCGKIAEKNGFEDIVII